MAITSGTTSGLSGLKFRQCSHCGRMAPVGLPECPHCKEEFPALPQPRRSARVDGGELRRGLLYMTLAAVIHYFAAGYSTWQLPLHVPEMVIRYMTPALFVLGLGFAVYGVANRLS
jgi:hypothetical protein